MNSLSIHEEMKYIHIYYYINNVISVEKRFCALSITSVIIKISLLYVILNIDYSHL